jgi:hypothetical protein
MKRYYVLLVGLVGIPSTLFGCQITLFNDTEQTIFAVDTDANAGYVLQPQEQRFFGEAHRRPAVTLYIQLLPDDAFRQNYTVQQIACALNESDKTISLSAIIGDTYNKNIYTVTTYAMGMDTLTCCGHHGSSNMEDMEAME